MPRPAGSTAPFFSWASTVGLIRWIVGPEHEDEGYYSTVTGWSSVARGLNPFGEVERASVRVLGLLITTLVKTDPDRKIRLNVTSQPGLQLEFYKDSLGEIWDGTNVVIVPIRKADRRFLFLVLVPCPSNSEINCFQRVDIADLGTLVNSYWLEGLEMTEVTII